MVPKHNGTRGAALRSRIGRLSASRVLRSWRFWTASAMAAVLLLGWSLALHYRNAGDSNYRSSVTNRAAVEDLTRRNTDLEAQLAAVRVERDAAIPELDTYKKREADLQAREAEVKRREGELKTKEEAVRQRESAVSEQEKAQAQNTISEGDWAVGVDVQPGTYRTKEVVSGTCYWAIHADANGEDIVANDIVTGGRPTVTLSNGQFFETSRCGDWIKVQ